MPTSRSQDLAKGSQNSIRDGSPPDSSRSSNSDFDTLVDADDSNPVNASPFSANAIDAVTNPDPFGLNRHFSLALILLFFAGLLLAFTPCVLPMLPIVSNIVARQHNPTARKGLLLSGSYALGVAVAYGLLGAAIAVFGQSLGLIGWLQSPLILLTFAAIFAILSLYMLDAFTITLPNKVRQKMQDTSQIGDKLLGTAPGSFIVGLLSALIVSPCVSAPLSGALLAVSTIGDPLKGFIALFMLGFGLSAPLMLLGAGQSNLMPKAGAWMTWIKQGTALALFGIALALVARVLISPIMLMLWALWALVIAGWLWSWMGRGQLLSRALTGLIVLWSTCLVVGAAAGSHNAWQPLSILKSEGQLIATRSTLHITELDELAPIINSNQKVLVEVTADWCVECRIIENQLFINPPASMQEWQLVKLDVTKTNEASAEVLSTLNLFGPPALLYFVDGDIKQRQIGSISRQNFESTLNQL